MSYRKYEIIEHSSSSSPPFFIPHPKPLDLASAFPFCFPSDDVTFSLLDFPAPFATDLIQIETTPFCSTYKRVVTRKPDPLKAIVARVESLESKLDRLVLLKEKELKLKAKAKKMEEIDRKYCFTAEIKGGGSDERKYKWTAEIEGDDAKSGKKGERKYQWITELNRT